MRWIEVGRSLELKGSIKIPGSKNSALALLAAACLADEPVTLLGIPSIADIKVISQIGREIGLIISSDRPGEVRVDPRYIEHACIDPHKSSTFRTAYYFIGALLAKFGKVSVGYPGGDDFVHRPIDQHIKALTMMGARFTFHNDYYEVEAAQLKGTTIYFDTITSGATINSMLAAVRAQGCTVLQNAARDPEVTDTANFLNQMGAKITGAGTDTIRIEGVSHLTSCTYTVIPDRLIAGAFLISAGITNGTVTVQDVIPEHLTSCIHKLQEIGLHVEAGDNFVTAHSTGIVRATRVRAAMYPGFPTDLQQPLTALLTQASGKSIVADTVFQNRFNHAYQLKRMGADIKIRSGVAFIKGGTRLKGAYVHASDIRAGICLILAGLAADGTTSIAGVHHIERGYENVVEAFSSLGANIAFRDSDDALEPVAEG
ncbi:UDP-N-acetylglucosamine 1-carboxyvinyltransferase [Gordoniibacillus kamchatkensis]|uniref:UDP-N-acetylglucosamine 1-carboxyvinyltransferase n=1 Tax=Gordoniibacillus kamchatkensis TaxID=1590651 RepID=A0ABR5AGX3_9BACL|nr:UDP-N-acetylglucosamine 1-carboxyvinyltransferase [Paenibacillus sp. VKM B-2647]KIL39993.1 UDP-N-acetylglucosamine 1-carboxyvinyltransferase [Paenibacillus sp. VKM B-2647]